MKKSKPKIKVPDWMAIKNPETGYSGQDLKVFRERLKKNHIDVTRYTGVSPGYLKALEDADKPIKVNLAKRLNDWKEFKNYFQIKVK